MIRTLFSTKEAVWYDRHMPHAVRVGDILNFGDDRTWLVYATEWSIEPKLVDKHGASLCILTARIKSK